MSVRVLAAAALLLSSSCSDDGYVQPTAGSSSEGGAGAAGTGGASAGAPSDGGMGASTSPGGGGEGGNPEVPPLSIAIVSPAFEVSFERAFIAIEVETTGPAETVTSLEVDGRTVDEVEVSGPAAEPTRTRLRLPFQRGSFLYSVVARAPDGDEVRVDASAHGGRLVAASLDTMVALNGDAIVAWGGASPSPQSTSPSTVVTSIHGRANLFLAIDQTGDVHQFVPESGELLPVLTDEEAVAIAIGGQHVLVLRADGTIVATGSNDLGQLGDGSVDEASTFVDVEQLDDIVAVAASDSTSYAVRRDGFVYAWGGNDTGQLGLGDEDDVAHPIPTLVPNVADARTLAAGRDHVLTACDDGRVYAWGEGSSGQLGDGSAGILAAKSQPVLLAEAPEVREIFASSNSSFAISVDGELFAWGQNSLAQLGVGDASQRTTPSPSPLGLAMTVAGGGVGGIAFDPLRTPWVWGSNSSGQLAQPLPPEGRARSTTPLEIEWP